MVYPELLEEISELCEDDIIIIPSSVHELLIFPKNNLTKEYSLDHLNDMIVDVNETQLLDIEVLSTHIYYYHRETKEITY